MTDARRREPGLAGVFMIDVVVTGQIGVLFQLEPGLAVDYELDGVQAPLRQSLLFDQFGRSDQFADIDRVNFGTSRRVVRPYDHLAAFDAAGIVRKVFE